MTEPKLRNCPFCGGAPKHNNGGNSVYGRLWWAVWCDDCRIEFRDREVWDMINHGMLDPSVPPKESFDRWNNRQEAAELADAIEPFAAVASRDIGDDETDDDVFTPMRIHHRAPLVTVGDMRRAQSALHKFTFEPND